MRWATRAAWLVVSQEVDVGDHPSLTVEPHQVVGGQLVDRLRRRSHRDPAPRPVAGGWRLLRHLSIGGAGEARGDHEYRRVPWGSVPTRRGRRTPSPTLTARGGPSDTLSILAGRARSAVLVHGGAARCHDGPSNRYASSTAVVDLVTSTLGENEAVCRQPLLGTLRLEHPPRSIDGSAHNMVSVTLCQNGSSPWYLRTSIVGLGNSTMILSNTATNIAQDFFAG